MSGAKLNKGLSTFDMTGKTVAITGASSGFGHHFAGVLASAGASVVLGARRTEKVEERVAEIIGNGGSALGLTLDVTDAESGVVEYEWAVGRGVQPKQQVQSFVSVGTDTQGSCTGGGCQILETGVVYVVTVRAWNGARLYTDIQSHGVYIDAIPPRAGSVFDGVVEGIDAVIVEGVDAEWHASTASLPASWSGFEDTHSGIAWYEMGIGSSSCATDVHAFVNVGSGTSGRVSGLTLTSGVRYFVVVRAVDMAGNLVDACTDGVVIDSSPLRS
jgi:NAD(P)-dependent dehydrogenase (short-subunit alcohol dehydrogenase family)